MGAGSVAAAAFIIPWLRARYSSNTFIVLANLLVVWVYVLMAIIRQTELFLGVAALAGVGWTLSASELWVAAQRSMPGWARGRMNATVIMVSQEAMALGGVIWGCAATKAGAGYTLLGAAFLFLISLVLAAPHERYAARRTDLPSDRQWSVHAEAMHFQCVYPANEST
jgi:predicted MFS family arabinose efflux permease